ncbi:PREDICTED: uncharacterized protein LOC104826292 [Tarenaya hassleriana]|uniref:uncharacterized protein LOC104826292 n=1 Tax=Tarenaya hassleriana TaxID=28532 RepID=UPI00053C60DD|nr:PREDICTED: uncharacterized protein LOC104826292 [Tarenaya hassleriana]XP_010557213.1 PREDICTED: uncharacterized protein LOC104826292 [Tarenaya hassleriana]
MGVKVATATTFLQWASQSIVPHSSSTAISSPFPKRRRNNAHDGRSLCCRFVPRRHDRSSLFGTHSTKLQRSKSSELWEISKTTRTQSFRRACIARLDSFSEHGEGDSEPEIIHDSVDGESTSHCYSANFGSDSVEPPWEEEMVHMSSIEMKANSVGIPLSLRVIKRKIQWEEGVREAGESAYCSVKKAFSSMVFIVRELHSFTLHMRELLFYEDLQGILQRVRKEMHASFVWLFQQVFSHTPTLMVYVMILLANFTVYSIGRNAAIAAAASHPPPTATVSELTTVVEPDDGPNTKFDSSSVKTFYVSSSTGRTASVSGNNGGGGGKFRPVTSGTDGDGRYKGSDHFRTMIPDGAARLLSSSSGETSVSGEVNREEEIGLWNSMVEELERMEASTRGESLDRDTVKRFVSPVEARIEPDDYEDYFKTELLYKTGLSQEPHNPLLLANYAQFLYLVAHDYDRAEECFRKAAKAEPADAEAMSKYANFLWKVRKDMWAAEEKFLEAISADPTNSYHSANYAHFLWNTGGDDTCFPLDAPHDT